MGKTMDIRKYIVPTLIPLTIGIERGFAFSNEGFEKDDETDAGWE